MVHSDRYGVSGNMLRQLCWWADLGGEHGDSLSISGRTVHPPDKSSREAGFFSGNCGNFGGGRRRAERFMVGRGPVSRAQ